MGNIDFDVLSKLTDEDIKIISECADLEMLLGPIKHCTKQYTKYRPLLGRLDKKSALVQKNLPRIACDLYKKWDPNYTKFFAMEATRYKKIFKEMLKEFMGDLAEPEQVSQYGIEDFKKILNGILDTPGRTMDLKLFFLQTKMFCIEINDDIKQKVENEWQRLKEISSIKKEIEAKFKQEHIQRVYEIREEMRVKTEKYNEKIKILENEIEKLKSNIAIGQSKIESLINVVEDGKSQLFDKQNLLEKKNTEIEELKIQTEILQLDLDSMTAKLQERKDEMFFKIQREWLENNQIKVSESKILEEKITQLLEEVMELEETKKQLEKTIAGWDEYVDTYFTNIDQKIIEHRIDSILYEKGYGNFGLSQAAIASEYPVNTSYLYVQKGYKVEERQECIDYDDYLEIVENNLSILGHKMSADIIYDCFNSAINTELCPLICGYKARELAMALIASRYAEKPEIISIPAGFGNINELVAAINMTRTDTVIIEDVFGKMNEGIILPLLRDSQGKIIVFTTESIEDIAHLQRYYFNYIQLIVLNKHANVIAKDYVYAEANELLKGRIYTGKEEGHKLARQIFEYIDMDNSYVLTRGNVICDLMEDKKDNTEENALLKIVSTELKWIIKESEKEKMIELFELNQSKYPRKLIECLG